MDFGEESQEPCQTKEKQPQLEAGAEVREEHADIGMTLMWVRDRSDPIKFGFRESQRREVRLASESASRPRSMGGQAAGIDRVYPGQSGAEHARRFTPAGNLRCHTSLPEME
jgi:hypothetical protein